MLILFSLTDLLLNLVDAQMDSLVDPYHYDALSADVIRPAFHYHSTNSERIADNKPKFKHKLGLGSAAISSVTTALSPILPFTGGIDLRREDYWTNGLFGSVSSVYEQVRDAFSSSSLSQTSPSFLGTPRGGSKVSVKSKSKSKKTRTTHPFALSSPEPFVPLREIAALTLKEVGMAFRYALGSTNSTFTGGKFTSGVSPKVKKVFDQMSAAAAASRGKGVNVPTTGRSFQPGDIDAMHFCAAMRIFAEWRVLRQLPEGYKGYAVGMNLGHKDIVQNVAKIEQAAHNYIDHRAESLTENDSELFSPTLRDLLQYEVDMGIQDSSKLPRLKEKSAAMGLLWVRRQLHYQTAIFGNVIKVPEYFESAKAAVSAAYNEVYDRYHGWAVQKIFTYSFQAAPETTEIYRVMNPERLEEVREAARSQAMGVRAGSHRQQNSCDNKEGGNPLEKFGRHIGREWDKLAGSVLQLFGHQARDKARDKAQSVRGGSDSLDVAQQFGIENYIDKEMERDAHEHIVAYLEVAKPLLDDLANLFDEFNMDDPTKV